LAESRSRAQGLILAGVVRVGEDVVTKAGLRVPLDKPLSVTQGNRFVSRAGEKLDAALDAFGVEVAGRPCLDAGASTGGFTDVLLGRGAERVLAVDVGYGQLDWSLRQDPRVAVLERTNVRHLKGEDLPFDPDLLAADLSFISLAVALRTLITTTPSIMEAIVLVKPQFEAGPDLVGRGGLVGDPGVRVGVILDVIEAFASFGFGAVDLAPAAVTGRKSGNQEYPLRLLRGTTTALDEGRVREVVSGA
ncbi:MAG TPA: TlyA family RNA methyltransferase, partial [Rubrobacter sp.]|nr:TlyA family RNA methyltransferase [Rubrobacter sp.]